MNKSLEFLKNELIDVERSLTESLQFDDMLMAEVGRYLAELKGKRLRPILTLFAAKCLAAESLMDRHVSVAAGIELVHMATLLHDDVIDKADTRRGKPSVNAKWGADVAILMADYLFSAAYVTIQRHAGMAATCSLSGAICRMCEGEIFQIEKRDGLLTVADYLIIIRAKTAELFSTCAEIGAIMADGDEASVEALRDFGLAFGIAFQLTDDLLDYTAKGEKWGKAVGSDIRNGKQTLPLIHAVEQADAADREYLLRSLGGDGTDLDGVLGRIKRWGGIEKTQQMAAEYTERALQALARLPQSEARSHLERLADYIASRQY